MLSVFLLVSAILAQGATPQRTIIVNTFTGHDRVTFDPARAPEVEVRRWVRLSPHVVDSNGYSVPEFLQLCVERDSEYLECGTRDWKAKNFVLNANVNLRRIRERIKTLEESSYPAELNAVVLHLKRLQEADLFFQTRLLEFIQNGQISVLSVSFGGIDPSSQCSTQIAKVAGAPDKDLAYRVATHEWWKCVNGTFRDKIGPYPVAAWNKFLVRYGIRESFIADPTD